MRVSVRLAQNAVVVMSSICTRATSESRAGSSVLHRTATAVCQSSSGTLGRQGVSLVVAARPTAGRLPARACNAMRQRWRYRLAAFSSGTLPVVKHGASLLFVRQAPTGVALVAPCGSGGAAMQPKAKVSQCSAPFPWFGREQKGGSPNTAPNLSVEGTVKRLRLLSAPHLQR
jgi:hypothetical protein